MENQSVLSKYKRQPKIYLNLPSGGKFYKSNPMEKSGSGELPIYSMTAKDELLMRTPDALMNGDATAEVIKSCCPLITDPWDIPMIDLDAILIAIRIATYGESMDVEVPIMGLEEPTTEKTSVDLREVLDSMQGKEWPNTFKYQDLTFHMKPLTYKQSTGFYQSTYEQQRLTGLLQREDVPDEDKLKAFKEGFKKLSAVTLDMILSQVIAIETPDGTESNPSAIRDFFNNTDKDTFVAVETHLEEVKNNWTIKPRRIKVSQELVDKGAPEEVNVPLMFDQSSFFVSR